MVDGCGVVNMCPGFGVVCDQILCKKNVRDVEYNMLPLRVMYVRLPSMSQCMILFATLEKRPQPLITRGMSKHTRPVKNAFIQNQNPIPRVYESAENERKKR
jgi:hypothetical protein